MNYELHPLCTLFPRMEGAEFDALVADIRANGLREPIVLHDDMILDGGNRYRACLAAGVVPSFSVYGGSNIVAFVLSANLHRRHMTPGQQAAIVATAQDWAKAHARGGNRKTRSQVTDSQANDQSATLHFDPFASTEDRAAASGASLRTQKMADKVAKADPELAKQVAHGEVSLPKAHAKVTKAPTAKQQRDKAARAEREQAQDDAFGDANLADELAEAHREILALQAQVEALTKDDQAAELKRQVALRQAIERRLGEETDKVHRLDKQLRKFGKWFETLRKLTGSNDNGDVIEAVRVAFKGAA